VLVSRYYRLRIIGDEKARQANSWNVLVSRVAGFVECVFDDFGTSVVGLSFNCRWVTDVLNVCGPCTSVRRHSFDKLCVE
jgi:hypothetical protein